MPLLSISVATLLLIGIIFSLRTRYFYFIRHGETVLNQKRIRQGKDGGLSEKGKEQAHRVGLYLKQFPIKSIISSDYPRAVETGEIIRGHTHASLSTSSLLAERRNPSEIIGKSTDDPEVQRIVDHIDLAYHEDDFRFSDEENFIDLKKRAQKCLALLSRQGALHTAVVTHHVFLKMLVSYMLHRERLHASDFVKVSFFNVSDNAGITICEFNPLNFFSPTRGWRVISYNEQPL